MVGTIIISILQIRKVKQKKEAKLLEGTQLMAVSGLAGET